MAGAVCQTKEGRMYFGGKNGISYFHPDNITNNTYEPPVVLTGLKLFYKNVRISDSTQTILKSNITVADEIVLTYNQNIITFEYAALNFIHSEMNEYKYTLEGFDETWHEVGKTREATYTSLDPGTYTFKVVASNNDGVWNKTGASIKVIVLPPWWQTWWFRSLMILVVLGIIIGLSYYKAYQLKKQNKVLEQMVQIRTEELTVANQEIISQNEQISYQRDTLERQNKVITQSITSAQRIQSALLPSDAELQSYFNDFFVIYQPRDIVSGDFYWAHWVGKYFYVIAADCTGHGIPGAFMSMLGNAMLNEIIIKRKIHDPAQILFELNKNIQETFKQTLDGPNPVDEGMDMTVLVIDSEANILRIASAIQPFYIGRNGKVEYVEGDMYSIGEVFARFKAPEFTTKTYPIEKGMCLFLGSDGIADQFSSETKKKFTSKRLIKVLEENLSLSMQGQAGSVHEAYEKWRSIEPQLDDILLLGLRF
ncbi:MAG: SpoIIE family protein phosphatase [Bacteroidales bacterium]|nr:SpoIIE family protein phosphatase [Bacteroidales bacterium]